MNAEYVVYNADHYKLSDYLLMQLNSKIDGLTKILDKQHILQQQLNGSKIMLKQLSSTLGKKSKK